MCIYLTEILSQGLGRMEMWMTSPSWRSSVRGQKRGPCSQEATWEGGRVEKCIPRLWPYPLHHHLPTLLKSSPLTVRDTTGLPWKRNSSKHLHKCLHFRLGLWICYHSCDVSIGKAWKPVCFLPQEGILFFKNYTKVTKLFLLLGKDIFLEAVERMYLFLLLSLYSCTQ